MLDMTKSRWEIRVYDKRLMVSKKHILEIEKGDIVRYNEHHYLCVRKERLLEHAKAIIEVRASKFIEQVEYYKNMKVKVTRK